MAVNEICLNDGKGNFENIKNFGDAKNQTIEIEVIDINKDGFFDLVTAERKSKNNIYLNNGKQNFSKAIQFGNEEDETRSIEIADFDKDGFLDILAGNLGSKMRSILEIRNLLSAEIYVQRSENDGFDCRC